MSKVPENVDFILRSRINLHYYDNAVILENQYSSHVIITNPFSESHYGSKLSLTSFRGDLYNSGYMVTREQQIPIHGCLGVIRLLTGWYIIVFTERQLVGTIQGSEVYLISKCSIFSIPGTQRDLSEEEKNVQKNYLTGLNNFLQTSGFYYSQSFDIFTNYQKKRTLSEDILKEPLWKRIDERFFWNRYLLQQFIDNNLNDWIIPVVDGFMRIEPSNINGCLFDYILISRRDCLRTGARFLTRGADIKGNVANFVETEQIVIFNGVISSWVETRGTIPLIWTQNGKSLKSKPEVSISPFLRNAFQSHISKHLQVYGTLVIVSLIDQRGHEQEIGEMYEALVRLYEFQDVKYIAYDFHEQCKNNNYANLDRLVEYLTDEMMRMSYYAQDPLGQPLNFQKGVVRTNCIDCLDRTGVVQSKLARYMLAVQLTAIGIFLPNDSIENHLNFQAMLNNLWTDNADTMSKRYTGVGALKTDFTRTGKRSATGAVADGMKSVSRLYQSAFNDDEKQISLDLFLGITILERQSKYLSQQTENSAPTFRFKTMMMNQEGKGEYAMIELVENYDQMTIYNIESCSSQFFNIFSIVQIEKSSSNYNLLTIVFNCAPFPKRISFSSTEKKEKFLYVFEQVKKSCTNAHLYQQNNFQQTLQSVTQNLIDLNFDQPAQLPDPIIPISSDPLIPSSLPSNQPPPLPSTPSSIPPPLPANRPSLQSVEENISIYIGSCNMNAVTWDVYPSFADCIPGGQDIYVISTQNYQIQAPPGYYFSGVIYWLLSLQLYFGPSYEVVQHSVCNKVALIILARKDIIWKISNITKSYVTVIEPVKIVAQSDSQVILNTTAKGIGNFFKAISKEVQKNLSESNNSSTPRPSKSANGTILKDPSDYIGVAIGFQYNESSLCFIACKKFNNIYRVLDMDVYNGFHQVFFVGDAPPELMQSKWGQLTGQGQYGSIYLRSLNDNNLQNILAPRELNPYWALPLSVCFSLPTLLPLQYNNSPNPIVISLSDLRGNELYIGDRILDPYLLVHSAILAKAMRTNSKRRTWNPEWNELLVLKPIFDNINMLEKRHLTLEVLDQEEGIVIGVGTIYLRDAFNARGELVDFKAAITSFEESRGYVTGKISIRTG